MDLFRTPNSIKIFELLVENVVGGSGDTGRLGLYRGKRVPAPLWSISSRTCLAAVSGDRKELFRVLDDEGSPRSGRRR